MSPEHDGNAPQKLATPSLRKALAVLGMHRSGTSAAARVLSLLGADLPANLMPPVENDNPRGFWEPERVAELHDEILAALGSAWDDVFPLPALWHQMPAFKPRLEQMLSLLGEEFGESTFFVLKDPRMCLMVPMWVEMLARMGALPHFVIMLRNPLEVAASLQARNSFPPTKSLAIWLRYMLDAELFTRGHRRTVVCYRDLLRDGPAIARKIGAALNIDWPRDHYLAHLEIEQFLSRADRHHAISDEELEQSAAPGWVKKAYFALRRMAAGAEDEGRPLLDAVRAELSVAENAFGVICADWRLTLRQARDALAVAEQNHHESRRALDELRARAEQDRAEGQRALDELRSRAEQERAAAAEQVRTAEQERAEGQRALEQALRALRERESSLEQLQLEARQAAAAIEARQAESAAAQQALRDKTAEFERFRGAVTARAEEDARQIALLHAQIARQAQEAAALQAELSELRSNMEALRQVLGQARVDLDESRRELGALRGRVRTGEESLAAKARQAGQLERELAVRQSEAATLQQRSALMRQELDSLAGWQKSAAALDQRARSLSDALVRWNQARTSKTVRHMTGRAARQLLQRAHLLLHRRRLRLRTRLLASGLFDAAYYLARNPDVVVQGLDPLEHFLACGAREGRWPCALFDTGWYMAVYQDTACSPINPLDHYLLYGAAEGRNPNPLFDTAYYLRKNRDVAESEQNPLAHYSRCGAEQGRRPHPLFDSAYYLRRYPDVRLLGLNPLAHYLEHGAAEGRNPNPLFDGAYYLRENPAVAALGVNPLQHYIESGAREGRNPNPFFESAYYLAENPSVQAAGLNPLVHYLDLGAAEGRRPGPHFDPARYVAENPEAAGAGQNPLVHFLEHGAGERGSAADRAVVPDNEARAEPLILQTVVPPGDRWSTVRQIVEGVMSNSGAAEAPRRSMQT